jgi:hypothetical protein
MKRFFVLIAVLVPLVVTGCGRPQLVVEAAITDEATGERYALSDLPIRLLPYDRDAIFDSLELAYPQPEPPIPADLMEQQQQVQAAQTAWQVAEERWGAARDEQRQLSDQLRAMENQGLRGTPQYRQAFNRFDQLDAQVRQYEQQMTQAFARFEELQQQSIAAADSIRVQREIWAEGAFADFNRVVLQKTRELGREEQADTTTAQGFARFRVPGGRWWVYARYTQPYQELYWNIPVEISGDSTYISLTNENAQVRPNL